MDKIYTDNKFECIIWLFKIESNSIKMIVLTFSYPKSLFISHNIANLSINNIFIVGLKPIYVFNILRGNIVVNDEKKWEIT